MPTYRIVAATAAAATGQLGSKIGFVRQQQEVTVVFAAAGLLLLVAGMTLSLAWFSRFP